MNKVPIDSLHSFYYAVAVVKSSHISYVCNQLFTKSENHSFFFGGELMKLERNKIYMPQCMLFLVEDVFVCVIYITTFCGTTISSTFRYYCFV